MSNVSGIIKSIQDIMRKDVGVDGDAQRISQLVWMFFLKIFDDREAELELVEDGYRSPLPEHLRWRNWAKNTEGITGDALYDFVNNQLFPALKEKLVTHGPSGKRAQVIRSVFEGAYNYMKSGTLMRQVINKICEIDFNNTSDRHTFGSIYEQILRDLQSAGNAGEFYTPRAITRFIVNRIDPKLEELVLDPACGTGGFLTCTIDHKREHYRKTKEDEEILVNSIRGVEKKALPHMLAVTNMILHGVDSPSSVKHDNTLTRPYKDYGNADRVHVIVTNPPFGGMEEDGIENNFPANFRTRETADLFVALIIKLLKDGGRAAVVLPDGFLFGEGMKTRLKQALLEECNLHTIVRLPNGVFNPYTGIRTNLLFFTKGKPTEQVWYYEHPYPEGAKSYSKTRPLRFEEFEQEINWWGAESDGFKSRVQTEQAWQVPIAEIVARNYNLDIKNPYVRERLSRDPEKLLQQFQQQQHAIADVSSGLKGALRESLRRSEKVEATGSGTVKGTTAPDEVKKNAGAIFFDQFDILFTSEHGVEQLRQAILRLAVTGRLVSQDPSDEPASVLLGKIRRRQAQLEEQGIIRKQKVLPDVREDEKPFALPNGWQWVKLGQLMEMFNGRAFKSTEWGETGLPIVRIQNLNDPTATFNYFDGDVSEQHRIVNGTFLISWSGTPGTSFGAFIWNRGNAALNQHINKCLIFLEDANLEYLRLSVNSCMDHLISSAQGGVGLKHVTRDTLNNLVFGYPPLAEQIRIVTKVKELMTLCDALNERLAESKTAQVHLAEAIIEQVIA